MRALLSLVLCLAVASLAQTDNPKKESGAPPSKKADSDVKTAIETEKEKKPEPEKKSGAEKKAERSKGKARAAEKKDEAASEEEKPKDPMSSGTFKGLKLRSIGPAFISGRISSIAVNPKNKAQYYAAAASGGVWKTENGGATFSPIFENEGSYSIGTVVIDPRDTNIVWVGTGENNSQRSVGYGDGVYRSDDGGKNWKHMGLKRSEHIARIVIDPRDSDVVYVASQGPLWGPGGDRGLFKSTDGGKTWKHSLEISEHTGVTDVVMDPRDPDVLYAASYQRRRHVFTLINGGPESAIYKSTDAGASWNKLKNGLPAVEMGRIGLAISPVDPNTVYAVIEANDKKGGIFRSKDRGATWERRGEFEHGAMYYSTIFADPKNVDRLYLMDVYTRVSDDGGKTIRRLGEKSKHVDNHFLWVDPDDTSHMLNGCDGGVYETFDGAQTWIWKQNLPLAQFYDLAVDNRKPFYYVYGGTQDNYSLGGPARTTSASGIINSDWFLTKAGDGFRQAVDPEDPNTLYAEMQYGGLVRHNLATGEEFGIQPQEGKGEPPLRWNWDSPFIISPHKHTRLYFAANRLFKTEDRGDTWVPISPDLTRQIDRDSLPVMGKIWGPDAIAKHQSTSLYGNIVALAESPKKEGLLYVGTDDGLIQVTEDGGRNWRKVEKFTGVPDGTYVTRIAASNHDANTVYASFDNHKNADFKPYIVKSADAGRTWRPIQANLPENGPVLALVEDPGDPNLLFAGTEFGLWFTVDGGGKWVQLKGGMPTIAVKDAVIQKQHNDLVIATFGRGFYILDDITPLRNFKPEILNAEAQLLPAKDAMMFMEKFPLGGRGKSHYGESLFTAENPPYGAIFTYYLKDKYKTAKEQRQEREKEAAKKNNGAAYPALKYPTKDELRAEADAQAPILFLTVADEQGNVIRRVAAQNEAGYNRVAWDLRYPPSELAEPREGGEIFPWELGPVGPLVMPGRYSVRLSRKLEGKFSDLSQPVAFTVYVDGQAKMAEADRKALFDFQRKLAKLDRAASGAIALGNELETKLGRIRKALDTTAADTNATIARVDGIEADLRKVMIALRGDRFLRQRNEGTPPAIADRINNILGDQRFSTAKPSQTHIMAYQIASAEFTDELTKLKSVLERTKQVEAEMERLGSPYTPGRVPEWAEER